MEGDGNDLYCVENATVSFYTSPDGIWDGTGGGASNKYSAQTNFVFSGCF